MKTIRLLESPQQAAQGDLALTPDLQAATRSLRRYLTRQARGNRSNIADLAKTGAGEAQIPGMPPEEAYTWTPPFAAVRWNRRFVWRLKKLEATYNVIYNPCSDFAYVGRLYVVHKRYYTPYTLVASYSDDGGETWTHASAPIPSGMEGGQGTGVARDEKFDFYGVPSSPLDPRTIYRRTFNGTSWEDPVTIYTHPGGGYEGPFAYDYIANIYAFRSFDRSLRALSIYEHYSDIREIGITLTPQCMDATFNGVLMCAIWNSDMSVVPHGPSEVEYEWSRHSIGGLRLTPTCPPFDLQDPFNPNFYSQWASIANTSWSLGAQSLVAVGIKYQGSHQLPSSAIVQGIEVQASYSLQHGASFSYQGTRFWPEYGRFGCGPRYSAYMRASTPNIYLGMWDGAYDIALGQLMFPRLRTMGTGTAFGGPNDLWGFHNETFSQQQQVRDYVGSEFFGFSMASYGVFETNDPVFPNEPITGYVDDADPIPPFPWQGLQGLSLRVWYILPNLYRVKYSLLDSDGNPVGFQTIATTEGVDEGNGDSFGTPYGRFRVLNSTGPPVYTPVLVWPRNMGFGGVRTMYRAFGTGGGWSIEDITSFYNTSKTDIDVQILQYWYVAGNSTGSFFRGLRPTYSGNTFAERNTEGGLAEANLDFDQDEDNGGIFEPFANENFASQQLYLGPLMSYIDSTDDVYARLGVVILGGLQAYNYSTSSNELYAVIGEVVETRE